MAYAVITFENKKTKQLKLAPIGFSWTNLFFGFFVPLFRGDWKWAAIFFGVGWITFGFGSFITCFFYNKLYAEELINTGFKVKSLNGADKNLIKASIGISRF
tara:strand:- start:261 stop:566 length:306 start_codon:yes stop_codon:yes gene_type:complete